MTKNKIDIQHTNKRLYYFQIRDMYVCTSKHAYKQTNVHT